MTPAAAPTTPARTARPVVESWVWRDASRDGIATPAKRPARA